MALFKKVNRKRQTHIINDVAHIDWQWEAIQCGVYMDSDWKKKQLTPPSVIRQKFWLDSANLVATECLEDMILIRLLFNPIIYAPCNHT